MIRFAVVLCLLVACTDATGDSSRQGSTGTEAQGIRLREVASGLERPVFLTAPAGDSRLFVVEQPGRIRVVENGQLLPTPFLDITSRVSSGGERGLLGLAFHPQYASNGLFFVNFTDREGDTQIERFRVSADRNRADPASAKRILSIDQPYGNHNGGQLSFGPDGKLFIGMGDGGSRGDPQGHGQNVGTLLGAMLRIDVDAGDPYAIPRDNPFLGRSSARGEIWATGLRNPWRWSFDQEDGLLYVADVGQNDWEEVSVVRADQGGLNFGWDVMEASDCFEPRTGCDRTGLVLPALEYGRSEGQSITGGYVYRGSRIPAVRGHYFYADYFRPELRSFRHDNGQAVDRRTWQVGDVGRISSFGEDAEGELYVLSHDRGTVFRLEASQP